MRAVLAALVMLAAPAAAQEIEVTPLEPLDPEAVIVEPVTPQPQVQPRVLMANSTQASLRGVDKLDGTLEDIRVLKDFPIRFGTLSITLGDCRYPADNPTGEAYAFLDIKEGTEPVFSGWMVASSPALNALDHHRYDVWVLRCKTSATEGGEG